MTHGVCWRRLKGQGSVIIARRALGGGWGQGGGGGDL